MFDISVFVSVTVNTVDQQKLNTQSVIAARRPNHASTKQAPSSTSPSNNETRLISQCGCDHSVLSLVASSATEGRCGGE